MHLRSARAVLLLGAALFGAETARADTPCAEAYKNAQELRLLKRLREAAAQALVCAAEPCAEWARIECARWFNELKEAIPRVRISVDVPKARIFVDGAEVSAASIELDPGSHLVRVETDASKPVEQKILVGEDDKEQTFFVHVAPTVPAHPLSRPERTTQRPVPWPVYALGAGGIASLVVFGSFGTVGVIERGDLESCRSHCAESDVDAVRTKYVVANIALGVGILALGAATVLYLVRER